MGNRPRGSLLEARCVHQAIGPQRERSFSGSGVVVPQEGCRHGGPRGQRGQAQEAAPADRAGLQLRAQKVEIAVVWIHDTYSSRSIKVTPTARILSRAYAIRPYQSP